MARRIVIETPARLHFGLVNPFNRDHRLYLSVGVAIDRPRTLTSVYLGEKFSIEGCRSDEAHRRLERFIEKHDIKHGRVIVEQCIPKHVGLGSTTQLLLSIVHGLMIANNINLNLVEVAKDIGLGRISGVGTYAYIYGGLIIDSGKTDPTDFPGLLMRIEVPENWRFVIVIPRGRGLDDEVEIRLFQEGKKVSEQLIWFASHVLFTELVPSLIERRFDKFSHALARFQETVGKMFSEYQGGVFASYSQRAVELLKSLGILGVGQSSWGPAIYGLVDSHEKAVEVSSKITRDLEGATVIIARPQNTGAKVKFTSY